MLGSPLTFLCIFPSPWFKVITLCLHESKTPLLLRTYLPGICHENAMSCDSFHAVAAHPYYHYFTWKPVIWVAFVMHNAPWSCVQIRVCFLRERITDTCYGSENQTKKNELAWMGIEPMAFGLALRRSITIELPRPHTQTSTFNFVIIALPTTLPFYLQFVHFFRD